MRARDHAIERWDAYISAWLASPAPPPLPAPLAEWRAGYRGPVTEEAMPEPYIGRWEAPRMVTLGLNPGEADISFQGRHGIFAGEIGELGCYSAWAASDPYGQPAWEDRHRINRYRRE